MTLPAVSGARCETRGAAGCHQALRKKKRLEQPLSKDPVKGRA
jgi:hypothetical protein